MPIKQTAMAVALAAAFTIPSTVTAEAAPRDGNKHFGLAVATYTPLINRRMKKQIRRIRNGRSAGKLTRHEARFLRSSLQEIRFRKRLAARDGVITRGERFRLHSMLDRNSLRIKRLKRNRNTSFGRSGRVRFSLGF